MSGRPHTTWKSNDINYGSKVSFSINAYQKYHLICILDKSYFSILHSFFKRMEKLFKN